MNYRKILCSLVVALLPVFAIAQQQLALSDAIVLGLKNNYDIQISKKNTEVSSIRNSWAMAGAVPTISLVGSTLANYELLNSTETTSAQLGAEFNWTLFDGFQIKATKELLENNEELAKGNEMLYIENTIQSIIVSYYYVLLQQEVLKVNKTIMDISYDRYEQQMTAKNIGSSGNFEFMQAKIDYLSDKNSYLSQENILRESVRNLNLLLSIEPDMQWTLIDEIAIPTADYQIERMKELMLKDNRTLKNQYINLKAKDIELKQQSSELYPRIGLLASFGTGTTHTSISNSNFLRPQIGVEISYTLFNGGKIKRNIDIAQIDKETEEVATEQIVLSLEKELSRLFDNYNTSKELVEVDTEQLELTEVLLKLSEERYKQGTINSFNFREVQLVYLNNATSRLNDIYSLIVSNSELLKLTGGILSYGN